MAKFHINFGKTHAGEHTTIRIKGYKTAKKAFYKIANSGYKSVFLSDYEGLILIKEVTE